MCVCVILAQNTPQLIFYSLLKLPLLGYEPKRTIFVCPFKGKWAGGPGPLSGEGGASRAQASAYI